jgi:cytoskeleton protein RodZ
MSDSVVEPAQTAAAAPRSDQLTAARVAAGFAVADVARQLKLSGWQVEALESGDYARLPGPVFVRGFIRNYARLLKLDPAPLLAEIPSQTPVIATVAPEPAPSTAIPFPGRRKFRWQPYAIGGLVVIAALVGYEFYGDELVSNVIDTQVVELPAPKIIVESVPVEVVPEPVPVPVAESPPPSAPAPTPSPVTVTAAAAPQRTEIAKVAPDSRAARVEPGADEHVIRMMFSRDSWVEIRDRQGRKIFSQLNSAGTAKAVSGQPPLSMIVGNATGVRVMHNDRPVDLAPYTQVDVARLTIE